MDGIFIKGARKFYGTITVSLRLNERVVKVS